MQPEEFSPIQLGEGLYYANAFEPLISTMVGRSQLSERILTRDYRRQRLSAAGTLLA